MLCCQSSSIRSSINEEQSISSVETISATWCRPENLINVLQASPDHGPNLSVAANICICWHRSYSARIPKVPSKWRNSSLCITIQHYHQISAFLLVIGFLLQLPTAMIPSKGSNLELLPVANTQQNAYFQDNIGKLGAAFGDRTVCASGLQDRGDAPLRVGLCQFRFVVQDTAVSRCRSPGPPSQSVKPRNALPPTDAHRYGAGFGSSQSTTACRIACAQKKLPAGA